MSMHKFFLYLAFIFGIVLVTVVPPLQSPDEDSHFKKVLVLSEGQFFPKVENGRAGFMLAPEDVEFITEKMTIRGNLSKKVSYKETFFDERLPWTRSEKEFYIFSTVNFHPIAHIIPAIGVFVGKVIAFLFLKMEPSAAFLLYFARIFNLCFYIAVTTYSIYITPYMKRTMCMVGLMPMALYLAATVSYDALLISLSFLLVAKILQLAYFQTEGVNMDVKDCVIYSFIAYIFLAVKVVYLPLFALFLLLPYDFWVEKRVAVKNIAIIFGGMIGLYLIYKIPEMILVRGISDTGTYAGEQLNFVIQHPITYLEIFFKTIEQYGDYYINSFVGCLGLLDTSFYSAFVYLYLIFFISSGIIDVSVSDINIKRIPRIVLGLGVVASIFGIYLAMYLTWTSRLDGLGIGAGEISGVQGRYFIPLTLSVFLLFANNRICRNERIKNVFETVVDNNVLVSLTMLSLMVIFLLVRFWC